MVYDMFEIAFGMVSPSPPAAGVLSPKLLFKQRHQTAGKNDPHPLKGGGGSTTPLKYTGVFQTPPLTRVEKKNSEIQTKIAKVGFWDETVSENQRKTPLVIKMSLSNRDLDDF